MKRLIGCLMKWLLALIGLSLLGSGIAQAQGGWQIGAIVGLRAGTCIREGPGLNYRTHTRVPEDDWAVKIIDGPRFADGHTWWDTSRRAAGDPSGGTGWVAEDQTDTDCPLLEAPSPPAPLPAPTPPLFIEQIMAFWRSLPDWARWGAAVLFLLMGLRLVGRALDWLLALLGALLGSAFIWIVLDLTRSYWEPFWQPLGRSIFGPNMPDLAFLMAMLLLAAWLLSTVGRVLRRI